MPSYNYRVVPFMGNIKSAEFSRQNALSVAEQLEALIQSNAIDGWEFYRMDQVQIPFAPGGLGSLTGKKQGTVFFDQAIFRQES